VHHLLLQVMVAGLPAAIADSESAAVAAVATAAAWAAGAVLAARVPGCAAARVPGCVAAVAAAAAVVAGLVAQGVVGRAGCLPDEAAAATAAVVPCGWGRHLGAAAAAVVAAVEPSVAWLLLEVAAAVDDSKASCHCLTCQEALPPACQHHLHRQYPQSPRTGASARGQHNTGTHHN